MRLRPHVFQEAAKIAGDVGTEAPEVDAGGLQHCHGLAILAERKQEVLEGHKPMRLLASEPVRALQAFAELCRNGKGFELVRKGLRHQSLPNRAQVPR